MLNFRHSSLGPFFIGFACSCCVCVGSLSSLGSSQRPKACMEFSQLEIPNWLWEWMVIDDDRHQVTDQRLAFSFFKQIYYCSTEKNQLSYFWYWTKSVWDNLLQDIQTATSMQNDRNYDILLREYYFAKVERMVESFTIHLHMESLAILKFTALEAFPSHLHRWLLRAERGREPIFFSPSFYSVIVLQDTSHTHEI